MQIGSGTSAMSGAQVALRLLAPPAPVDAPARKAGADAPAGAGDVSALMTYAKEARALDRPAASAPPADPAMPIVPAGYSVGDLVPIDTLEPEFRDFAQSLGASHVRIISPDPVDDADFIRQTTAFMDQIYAGDAAYLAAKAAGQITIRRESEVLAELGDTRATWSSMAHYRGPGGSEYFGSGGTGITSLAFERWQAAEQARGSFVDVGGVAGTGYVATSPAKAG